MDSPAYFNDRQASIVTLLAALAAALSAYLLLPAQRRMRRAAAGGNPRENPASGSRFPRPGQIRLAACVIAAIACVVLFSGALGMVAGIATVVAGPKLIGALEGGAQRRRRNDLAAAAPLIADLMAACLAAGTSPAGAAAATRDALDGPAAELLAESVAHHQLGADVDRVWEPLAREPSTAPIARAIIRSSTSGAPITSVLLTVADDLRDRRRAELDQAAKAVGIKAVGPLGLCFLPAFMMLGIVPLIASLISRGVA